MALFKKKERKTKDGTTPPATLAKEEVNQGNAVTQVASRRKPGERAVDYVRRVVKENREAERKAQ